MWQARQCRVRQKKFWRAKNPNLGQPCPNLLSRNVVQPCREACTAGKRTCSTLGVATRPPNVPTAAHLAPALRGPTFESRGRCSPHAAWLMCICVRETCRDAS
eukprot:358277-Chlamydomonas_euryale.AAC.4